MKAKENITIDLDKLSDDERLSWVMKKLSGRKELFPERNAEARRLLKTVKEFPMIGFKKS